MKYHVVIRCAASVNFCDQIPRWHKHSTPSFCHSYRVDIRGAVQCNVEAIELALYKLI